MRPDPSRPCIGLTSRSHDGSLTSREIDRISGAARHQTPSAAVQNCTVSGGSNASIAVDWPPSERTKNFLGKKCSNSRLPAEQGYQIKWQRKQKLPDLMDKRATSQSDLNGLRLVTGEELAEAFRFSGVTGAFRKWCAEIGVASVPGRKNLYDPKLVRDRLDAIQGPQSQPINTDIAASMSLVEKRRIRCGNLPT